MTERPTQQQQEQTMNIDPFDSPTRPKPFSYWQAAPWTDETQEFFRRFYSHTFDDGSAIELKRREDGAVLARGMREGKLATWTTCSSAETIRHEGLVNDYLAALNNPRAATPPRDGHKLILFHAARDSITAASGSIDRDTLLSLAASRMQKPKKGADRRRADSAPRALRELLADGVLHVMPSGRLGITYDERFNDDEADDGNEESDEA